MRLVALLLEICMALGKLGMASFMHVFFFVKVVFWGKFTSPKLDTTLCMFMFFFGEAKE